MARERLTGLSCNNCDYLEGITCKGVGPSVVVNPHTNRKETCWPIIEDTKREHCSLHSQNTNGA